MDNKVVSLTSSLKVSGLVTVKQHSGSHVLNLKLERALKAYQEGMNGVHRGDQYHERGTGFAASHITRNDIKSLLCCHGLHDSKLFFAWNMSVSEVNGRYAVKRCEHHAVLSEEMISHVNTCGEDAQIKSKCLRMN